MASERDICVLGLRLLGQVANITNLGENSVYADTANSIYPTVRDALLEHHAWNFATTTVRLQRVEETPVGWGTAYALPADCIRALHVAPDPCPPPPKKPKKKKPVSDVPPKDPVQGPGRPVRPGMDVVMLPPVNPVMIENWDYMPWTVEMLGPHRVLLTEMPLPVLKYVRRVKNPDFFSPSFTYALAWHLAAALAGPVVKGDTGMTVSAKLLQTANSYEKIAIGLDVNSRRMPVYRPEAPWYR